MQDPVLSGRVHNLSLHPGGQWFNEVQDLPDGSGKGIQAVLGEGMARELGHDQGKPTLGPGDVFDLGPRKWVVTGVLQSAGSTFDSEVWAKQSRVGEMFGKPSYTTVVLRTADAASAKRVADDLTKNYKTPAVVGPAGDGILREAQQHQPAIPLHDRLYRHYHGGGRRVRRDERHVRGRESADQGHRRTPHSGLFALAGADVVLPGIAAAGRGRRPARLRRRLRWATAGRRRASPAAARAAARAWC